MAKKNYSEWPKEDLIARLEKLEKRKKYGLVWDEEKTSEVSETSEVFFQHVRDIIHTRRLLTARIAE